MATVYQCTDPHCGEITTVLPQDEKCPVCKAKLKVNETGERRTQERISSQERIEGLCVLVCDASYSMNEKAFPSEQGNQTKLELVTEAVQSAVDAMHNLSMIDHAYIAIVAFGADATLILDRQGKPFIKSVKNILDEFGEQKVNLASYLQDRLEEDKDKIDRGSTNITGALDLAYEIADSAMKGDLSAWQFTGRVSLIPHVITPDAENPKYKIELPNVRVMIYSDGDHNVHGHVVRNPFVNMKPTSVLLTAFIGSPETEKSAERGADTMKKIAAICPVHNDTSYFLIDRAVHGELLRQLFRMATTYSGFCTECAREERKTQQKERSL